MKIDMELAQQVLVRAELYAENQAELLAVKNVLTRMSEREQGPVPLFPGMSVRHRALTRHFRVVCQDPEKPELVVVREADYYSTYPPNELRTETGREVCWRDDTP